MGEKHLELLCQNGGFEIQFPSIRTILWSAMQFLSHIVFEIINKQKGTRVFQFVNLFNFFGIILIRRGLLSFISLAVVTYRS